MSRSAHGLAARAAGIFGSLEKRLIGALLLIVICTGALQVISQDRAFRLRSESELLRVTASNTEHAEQLAKEVSQFRLATYRYLAPGDTSDEHRSADELTDAAMLIGEQVNALRMSGMNLYDLPRSMAVFDGIDRHVAAIDAATRYGGASARTVLDKRNADMAALASVIEDKASGEREAAFAELSRSTRDWQLLVTATGGFTVAIVLLILLDLLRNILPALRRMHAALRRLADGDLDFEVEEFRLHELKALSGSLDTFRRNAQAVKSLAFTDPSTGLPNRRAFAERSAAQLAAGSETGFVIILADVDKFKHVNDDYGHSAGDRLVQLIGERMGQELGAGAIVARVGGDEFAVCVELRPGQSGASLGADLVAAVRHPFDMGECAIVVTISLGLVETMGGEANDDINGLLNQADLALYAAKNGGRNCAIRFTSGLEEERELNRALERDLAEALGGGQLRMVYQPIHTIDARGEIEAGEREVEALVRWRHPALGDISPARFIPAAERSGLMAQLGHWIVEQALGDLARWPDLTMSINLSPLQLQHEGFVGFLLECCRTNGIAPQRIILEVTESFSIERNTRALLTLTLLRGAGFRIALDDFGTGYSSLCMMKTFKFDRLKLDRSLICDIAQDETSQAVFDAAVTMALRIGAEVVAEGISEEALIEPVRNAGCTHVQGFHYSRPLENDAIEDYYDRDEVAPRRVA
jgi:diguanylate cyclase (GGDEF)-like protein